jgi:hypothetical protein
MFLLRLLGVRTIIRYYVVTPTALVHQAKIGWRHR